MEERKILAERQRGHSWRRMLIAVEGRESDKGTS